MEKSDEYRARAIECLRLAQTMEQPENKTVLREMARAWVTLVEHAREREREKVEA